MPRFGKAGSFGHLAFEAKPAEPAVGQIEMHLLDQPPLRTDAVDVTDQEHADHQFGIERWAAHGAVISSELLPYVAQINYFGDLAQ